MFHKLMTFHRTEDSHKFTMLHVQLYVIAVGHFVKFVCEVRFRLW